MSTEKSASVPARTAARQRSAGPFHGSAARSAELLTAERQFARASKSGDIPAALRSANALIRLNPEAAVHHFNKALLCQHQSEIELAVYEFMHAIWLEPDGPHSEAARAALHDLDMLQLHQIAVLADDDLVFRTKLGRDCREAAMERGFALSPVGEGMLQEYCDGVLGDRPRPPRAARYQ